MSDGDELSGRSGFIPAPAIAQDVPRVHVLLTAACATPILGAQGDPDTAKAQRLLVDRMRDCLGVQEVFIGDESVGVLLVSGRGGTAPIREHMQAVLNDAWANSLPGFFPEDRRPGSRLRILFEELRRV